MSQKYANGMWKTTSKQQDDIARNLFLAVRNENKAATMGYDFNNFSGILKVTISTRCENGNLEYYLDRNGKFVS